MKTMTGFTKSAAIVLCAAVLISNAQENCKSCNEGSIKVSWKYFCKFLTEFKSFLNELPFYAMVKSFTIWYELL